MKNKQYEIIFFAIGLVAISIMVYSMGWTSLIVNLKEIGLWFIAIVSLRLVVYPLNTKAWQLVTFTNHKEKNSIPYLKMLQMTISGYAINYITPVMALGGEPYRILELKKYINTEKATSSVISYSAVHIMSHFIFWAIGGVIIIIYQSDTAAQLTATTISACCIATTVLMLRGANSGVVTKFFSLCLRIPLIKKAAAKIMTQKFCESLAEIDNQISNMYNNHRLNLVKALTIELFSRIVGCLEVLIIAHAIGINISFWQAIIVSAESTLFANALFFSPMQLGTREGGLTLAFKSIGLPGSTGIFTGIIMRISELVWITIGIAMIELTNIKTKHTKRHAYIFDYGGTLDTNGIHWYNIFKEQHLKHNPQLCEDTIRQAYIYAEQMMDRTKAIDENFTFRQVLEQKINMQCLYLINKEATYNVNYKTMMVDECYNLAHRNTENAQHLLKELQKHHKLAIVSNFYGNLSTVLKDFGLLAYFETVIESNHVGVSKPDKEIFKMAIEKLGLKPESCTVVGDSYQKDIIPAKALGCHTIWLNGKGWNANSHDNDADRTISSIYEIIQTNK